MNHLKPHYPVRVLCDVLDYSRSGYYYQAEPAEETSVKAALVRLAGAWPTYGYRRLTVMLQREGVTINTKRVRRLMQQLGLKPKIRRKTRGTTDSRHAFPRYPNLIKTLVAEHPDQVWVADITYIRLQRDFVYLAVLMDVCTRQIRGWHLSRGLDQDLTLTALRSALEDRCPEIHHSDQGLQYAANSYVTLLQQAGVAISMAEVGEAAQNGYAERLMRTIKEEEVYLADYQDFAQACEQIGHFIDEVYRLKRIHSALGYLTPQEFEMRWQRQQAAQPALP